MFGQGGTSSEIIVSILTAQHCDLDVCSFKTSFLHKTARINLVDTNCRQKLKKKRVKQIFMK